MVTITVHCPFCQSDQVMKYGRTPNDKQRYKCQDCGRQHRENPAPQGYLPERREDSLRAYEERSSLRGLNRTFGVSRNTVTAWIKKADQEPPLEATLVPAEPTDVLELDELWSFVIRKMNQSWLWLAICRRTRQVVAYAIGDRSLKTCQCLWDAIPAAYRAAHCFHDFWEAYAAVLPPDQHTAVGKESGQTNHVERFNNTLRQRLARLVRKSLSFSKSAVMHDRCIRLFLGRYNRERAAILD